MINKQQVIDEIKNSTDVSQSIKDDVLEQLAKYPDQLTKEQALEFDTFLATGQDVQMLTANEFDDIAKTIDTARVEDRIMEEKVTKEALNTMRDGLQTAQTVVNNHKAPVSSAA